MQQAGGLLSSKGPATQRLEEMPGDSIWHSAVERLAWRDILIVEVASEEFISPQSPVHYFDMLAGELSQEVALKNIFFGFFGMPDDCWVVT